MENYTANDMNILEEYMTPRHQNETFKNGLLIIESEHIDFFRTLKSHKPDVEEYDRIWNFLSFGDNPERLIFLPSKPLPLIISNKIADLYTSTWNK